MKAILIPVKEFREAKKRLAPHFPPAERAALAEAMCEDFFRVVAATRCADRVFVISKEPGALTRAEALGWETIVESHQTSESDSVDAGARYCAEQGVEALLRLPVDLPLVEPADIESVFANLEAAPTAVLVPSSDGTGTNALLRSPAVLIRVLRNPRLELDIDELEDLRQLADRLRPDSATARWLAECDLSTSPNFSPQVQQNHP
ncbi:MAG: NTP transferase domain-containing protein [Acidobacteriia bacterium]|nr:NTP transferase domain-containing protein [Terriglobia bacterium]